MMLELDHLAVSAPTLEQARAHVETALGVSMQPGGQHAHFGTHNHLLGMEDGLYLEAIAIDPSAEPPRVSRWFDLDRITGAARLGTWICRCDDLEAALALAPQEAGAPVDLARGDLRWRMAVAADGRMPFGGAFPALMQWQGAHPAARLAPSGCRLRYLVITHPQASELKAALAPLLTDARLVIEAGEDIGLRAEIDTPAGLRILT